MGDAVAPEFLREAEGAAPAQSLHSGPRFPPQTAQAVFGGVNHRQASQTRGKSLPTGTPGSHTPGWGLG